MEEERTETQDIIYEIVKDANIGRFFAYDLQAEDDGFWLDDEDNVMGAVVHFETYPTHETLTGIYEDLLVKAVMHTQDVDEDEALELVQDFEDEDDYPDLSVSNTFSILFAVDGHRGLYRTLRENGDYWTGHSTGRRGDRWEI